MRTGASSRLRKASVILVATCAAHGRLARAWTAPTLEIGARLRIAQPCAAPRLNTHPNPSACEAAAKVADPSPPRRALRSPAGGTRAARQQWPAARRFERASRRLSDRSATTSRTCLAGPSAPPWGSADKSMAAPFHPGRDARHTVGAHARRTRSGLQWSDPAWRRPRPEDPPPPQMARAIPRRTLHGGGRLSARQRVTDKLVVRPVHPSPLCSTCRNGDSDSWHECSANGPAM